MTQEPDALIVERDRLELERRQVMALVVDVDRRLQQRAIAILPAGAWFVR